jgi:DNA-binding MarR family transcriptional regulator
MGVFERFGICSGKDNFREKAIYALACAYSRVEKEISDYLRPFNITPAKFNAMMVIKHVGKEEGLSQIDIGRRLIVTASNMTRLVDSMEREGYIERLTQKGDRRVNLIRISKKGSDLLDHVWPGYYKRIAVIANQLNRDELIRVSGLLLKLASGLEGVTKKAQKTKGEKAVESYP